MTTHGAGSEPRRAGHAGDESPLAARIEGQIEARACGRIRDLHVVCSQDSIILQGRARTHHAKQLAQEAALDHIDLEGSPTLMNEIVVA